MDWANERYVRIYVRDTADDLVLSWQASGLWPQLVRKADRSGVIATNHGARGIAALVRWPVDVVTAALAELVQDGRIQECLEPAGYVIPNYIEAQETPSSDKHRKKEERERRREGANNSVTKRDIESRNVTETSRSVTPGHAESHDVTPYRAVPCQAVERMSGKPDSVSQVEIPTKTDAEILAETAVTEINRLSGSKYEATSKSTLDDCKVLAKSKRTAAQVVSVIASKREWVGHPTMAKQFKPSVLLRPSNFAKYLEDIEARRPVSNAAANDSAPIRTTQREEIVHPLMALIRMDEEPDAA